jgi:hypothetical protein
MAKKAATDLTTKSAASPAAGSGIAPGIRIDARIAMGMFFTLTGTILTAFGLSTRGNAAVYAKSLGIDVNLWWGLPLLVFGIVLLTLGRRGQMKMDRGQSDPPAKSRTVR